MKNNSWKISDVTIANRVVIAPMAGISNQAFRYICKEFGAGLIYTEMVSDKALYYQNVKTLGMTQTLKEEHPLTMQIFGSDVESMVYAAKLLDQETDCDIIDINMGCPVNKVVKAGAGSALMKDPEHAAKIVSAVVAAVKKPVTVKMRIGWDETCINAVPFALAMEAAGASAVAVHARTRKQMYEGHSDWRYIKAVKEALHIPVIGNGDIHTPQDAQRMLEETGCDAVMIGRGVLGDPWLIRQCVHALESGEELPNAAMEEKFSLAKEHARRLVDLKGEYVGIREMRGHAAWYVKGLPNSHRLKDRLAKIESMAELEQILGDYAKEQENEKKAKM